MRILVTNDDGIDSEGLRVLACAMRAHGEVVVVAPDGEYSGASAALGALHRIRPEVHRARLEGLEEAWSLNGPPALCVTFARLGAFGPRFDLVVAGINPGANVGRSVYHSGTVGAAMTARAGGVSGVAVSQAVRDAAVEGQAEDEDIVDQHWESAAAVGARVVGALVSNMPKEPLVANINVPNRLLSDMAGWRSTDIATVPERAMSAVTLEPKAGHSGSFRVRMHWGRPVSLPPQSDGGAIQRGMVSVTMLAPVSAAAPASAPSVCSALDELFTERSPE